ncbi:hypothetical protein ACFWAR_00170 [Streptomyces sp. NPDC059917]|uniref:hypothetical protein n=1 Tax=Streptomyces sp. NPDC059917 TaxID=3347002 RepID=UPI00364D42EF
MGDIEAACAGSNGVLRSSVACADRSLLSVFEVSGAPGALADEAVQAEFELLLPVQVVEVVALAMAC